MLNLNLHFWETEAVGHWASVQVLVQAANALGGGL